ncbi:MULTISPECIES: hypothetical protein [Streptosporangium]|uniref:Uncharacterized protein n=1 Tax=Streptosporangium brasiliense TaxID=47480 RepID=A0ABT9R502_9ACTN|nr:hypothetical protein [Streptosporangium brasiliense]MDP9864311.1 hypothetical protein [Streptosporangium brasiliense]
MTYDRSEAELARTLAGAADAAPPPVDDLLAAVHRRRGRRTRRRVQSALAVAGVIAVIGGGTAVARGSFSSGGGEGNALTKVTAAPSSEDRAGEDGAEEAGRLDVRPAAEVWPSAVSTIPAAAPDGWRYRPVTGLSATELLLTAESSFEKAGRLEVYDTATRERRILTEMTEPPGVKGYFVQDVEVGPEHIAWYGTRPNSGEKWADFWVVPRSGGTAKRIAEVSGGVDVERIAVTRDHVLWSDRSGGVSRVPITGGTPEKVPGGEGLHLLSWPWAADYVRSSGMWKNQSALVNLETGERQEIQVPDGVSGLRCSETWCAGQRKGGGLLVQRPDGSDSRDVADLSYGGDLDIALGRHLTVSLSGPSRKFFSASYDLATGAAGGIGWVSEDGTSGGMGTGISSSPSSIHYWRAGTVKTEKVCHKGACGTEEVGKATEYTVLNLLAVPPAE